jgi:tetratricopeptide (TPR) repeat protein
MPQVVQIKSIRRKRLTIAGVAVCLAIAALVGLGFYLSWRLFPTAATSVSQAQALDNSGNYTQALAVLQSAYSRALFKKDKVLLLPVLAATEYDATDYNAALTYYEQLNKDEPNNEANLQMLGDTAYQVGNKSVALQAYQEELPLREAAKTVGPTTKEDNQDLVQRIAELKQ